MKNRNSLSGATRRLTHMALLLAVEIVLSRFVSIPTPILKISVSFLPLSMVGILYGPFACCVVGGLADFIGAMLFPTGAYFPGFTLTAALTGLVYGLLLGGRPRSWWRIGLAVAIITVLLQLGLNTYWITWFTGKGYLALLPPRVFKTLAMLPLQTAGIGLISYPLCERMRPNSASD